MQRHFLSLPVAKWTQSIQYNKICTRDLRTRIFHVLPILIIPKFRLQISLQSNARFVFIVLTLVIGVLN